MIKLFQFIKNKFVNIFKLKNEIESTNNDESNNNNNIAPIDINTINLSITKLSKFEDVLEICDKLSIGEVVCVTLNHVEDGTHQRIVDFLSGFCLTINASFNTATKHIFMLIPEIFEEEQSKGDENSPAQIV